MTTMLLSLSLLLLLLLLMMIMMMMMMMMMMLLLLLLLSMLPPVRKTVPVLALTLLLVPRVPPSLPRRPHCLPARCAPVLRRPPGGSPPRPPWGARQWSSTRRRARSWRAYSGRRWSEGGARRWRLQRWSARHRRHVATAGGLADGWLVRKRCIVDAAQQAQEQAQAQTQVSTQTQQ
jgi:hypothetical protein